MHRGRVRRRGRFQISEFGLRILGKRDGDRSVPDNFHIFLVTLVTLGVSLSSTQFGGIDDERSRFAHFPNCGCRVVRLQIDAPARVFNHGGPNA